MPNWDEVADGGDIDINKYLDFREYDTTAERDTASVSFGSLDLFKICRVVETGHYFQWNGASWSQMDGVTGGAGASVSNTFVTINAEAQLTAETQHANITGANLHVTKAHKAEHENAGADEISVLGLSGLLADEQDAGKIKGKDVDDAAIGDAKILKYDLATTSLKYVAIPGGGDMTKAAYDITATNTKVDTALDAEKLNGQVAAFYAVAGHKNDHKTGGSDAFVLADLLDSIGRVSIDKNGVFVGSRRNINLIEGTGVTLTVTDDAGNEKVDVRADVVGTSSPRLAPSYTIYKVGATYFSMEGDGTIGPSDAKLGLVLYDTINALTSGGWVHLHLVGTHTLEIGIRGLQDNIRLSGLGKGVTELKLQDAKQSLLTNDSLATDTTIDVADGTQFEEKQLVVIDDDNSSSEQHFITSISGDTLTFNNGVVGNFTVAQNAVVKTASNLITLGNWDCHGGAIQMSGHDWTVEHLRLDGNRANQLVTTIGDSGVEACCGGVVVYNTNLNADNFYMHDCVVEGTLSCVVWNLSAQNYPHKYVACDFLDYDRHALVFANAEANFSACNFVSNNASRNLEFEEKPRGSVIGCFFDGNGVANYNLSIFGDNAGDMTAQVRVVGNRFTNIAGANSIIFGQAADTTQRVTCIGNICEDDISYENLERSTIVGNVCDALTDVGGSANNEIAHNQTF